MGPNGRSRRKKRNLGGRPTKYKPEYAKQAYEFCLSGHTVEELAAEFGVNPDTIYEWKRRFPEFSESIRKGCRPADAKVAHALFRRALGYRHKAVKIFSYEGDTFEHEYTEIYPPDFQSIRFWLMNRRPDKWRDREPENPDKDKLNPQLQALAEALNQEPAKPGETNEDPKE